jgi:type I restriction enzyme S subunit
MKLNSTNFNSDWNNKTLSELGTFARGKSRHRPRNDPALYTGGCHPLIQTGDITQATFRITSHSATYNDMGLAQSKLWPEGTLCITIAANIAETAILGYPMCFPDSVVGFSANPDETSEVFMHYVFTYIRKAIQNSVTGSIQDNINIEYLTNLRFKIPSPDEQDRIASVLSTLDAKIDLNNRINAELETLAKTIYDYWFVQFDFPDTNGRPYKSSGGAMVWNDTLKREIPAGWEGDDISAVAEVLGGATPSKANPDYWNGDIPFFTPTDAAGDIFQLQTEDSITQTGLNSCSSDLFAKGTVFITARGSVGKIAIAGRPMAMNQSCYALAPKIAANYPYVFLHAKTLIHHLKVKASGSTFNSIVTNDIEWTQLISPRPEVISAFCEIIAPMFQRIETAQRENHELTQLRDWLLPLLMNSQVRVA